MRPDASMPRRGRFIARGGNGEVYVLADDDAVVCKVLARGSGDGPPRFVREVTVLQTIDHPGVIKVLESNVGSAERNDRLWFTMPRAEPFPSSRNSTVHDRLGLLAAVARTLADLAAVGIYHRDIKPSNLLLLAGQPVVADFGLVTTPEDVGDLTARKKKLGSNFYIPSEMINDPASAAGGPVDVYSFGKTIWVVVSGSVHPLNRIDGKAALSLRLPSEPRLNEIDSLLSVMTSEDPNERPSMDFVAHELAAWVSPVRDAERVWPDVRHLVESAKMHERAATAEVRARGIEVAEVRSAADRFAICCEPALQFLQDQGAPVFRRTGHRAFQYSGSDLLDLVQPPPPVPADADESPEIRVCISSLVGQAEGQPGLRHFVGVVKARGAVQAVFVAGAAITLWGGSTTILQAGAREALIGAPNEAHVLKDLSLALADRLESDVRAWREAIIQQARPDTA